jgi:type I restriction enzyme S subunit
MILSSEECIQHANSYSDGTRMPRVNWESLSKYPIIIPADTYLELFQDFLNPILERMTANIFENQTLTQLRDNLLPQLMTGKITVKEA